MDCDVALGVLANLFVFTKRRPLVGLLESLSLQFGASFDDDSDSDDDSDFDDNGKERLQWREYEEIGLAEIHLAATFSSQLAGKRLIV